VQIAGVQSLDYLYEHIYSLLIVTIREQHGWSFFVFNHICHSKPLCDVSIVLPTIYRCVRL